MKWTRAFRKIVSKLLILQICFVRYDVSILYLAIFQLQKLQRCQPLILSNAAQILHGERNRRTALGDPVPCLPGRTSQSPSVVLEVAHSETRERVIRDMGWWLYGSAGAVLRGISIDIKQLGSGNMCIN